MKHDAVCNDQQPSSVTSRDMASPTERLECPLCDFAVLPSDHYVLRLHFEQVHTTDSPFIIEDDPEPLPPPLPARPSSTQSTKHLERDTPSSDEDENLVLCPVPDCGELILLADITDHLDYHAAESLSFDETTGQYHSHRPEIMYGGDAATHPKGSAKASFLEQTFSTGMPESRQRYENAGRKGKKKLQRGRSDTSSSEKSTLSRSILAFNPFAKADKKVKPPASSCRLGKSELGPHAWEDRMPRWLHDQLAAGPKITVVNRIGRDGRLIKQEQVQNETPGIIPILAQLSALDHSVKEAYYCHPSTLHIGKTPKEGGFCGYRNIQMLISYIQGAKAQGFEEFQGRTPGILKLQDLIERAWDKGINEIGRQQTGGIRDTRKYIGTPEAQAFFLSSQIDCAVEMFSDSPDGSFEAHEQLLTAVERYFAQAAVSDGSHVYKTLLPPIYLQEPGHSLTIIGFERHRDGTCNLLVYDPMYNTSPAMHKLVGRKNIRTARPEVLYSYRRVAKQLRRHAAFEVLMLTAHPPLFPAWDVLRQFPDCRFLYVFFRSRTLGYDVYPEDHFLKNFPWQQYGGLWIVDECRFARAANINPLIAQALRRITGEGASTGSSCNNSMASSFNSGSFHQLHSPSLHSDHDTPNPFPTRQVSFMSSYDGSAAGISYGFESSSIVPVLNMIGMHNAAQEMNMLNVQQAKLALLTEVGRRYPGYPSPLSPTFDAKQLFPSPASEIGSISRTPRAGSPALQMASPAARAASPMSLDGSEMCGPSRRCMSHGYERYVAPLGLIPSFEASEKIAWNGMTFVPEARIGSISPTQLRSPPASHTGSSLSPTSPPHAVSPRTAMLKNMVGKQALQSLSHQPHSPTQTTPPPINNLTTFPSPPSSPSATSPPAIPIANGLETATASPISASGTMLSYTSNRSVDSGLLAVRPLSEAQVAEYRFWRPCGRRACAFGCGGVCEGEAAAAKRLFREVRDVLPEEGDGDGDCNRGDGDRGREGDAKRERERESVRESVGEGLDIERRRRTMHSGVGIGIGMRERDGVAEV